MTLREQVDYIVEQAKTELPALLAIDSLANFDEYLNKSPSRSDQLQFAVYPEMNKNSTDMEQQSFIVHCQLNRKNLSIEYYDVIKPFLKKYIKPSSLGYTNRVGLDAEFYPIDRNGTSFVFFYLTFSNNLDDCEE